MAEALADAAPLIAVGDGLSVFALGGLEDVFVRVGERIVNELGFAHDGVSFSGLRMEHKGIPIYKKMRKHQACRNEFGSRFSETWGLMIFVRVSCACRRMAHELQLGKGRQGIVFQGVRDGQAESSEMALSVALLGSAGQGQRPCLRSA
jgi:hypothetical protein